MAGKPWSQLRHEQWRSRHPSKPRSAQRRLAQARYRKLHAKKIAQVREISNLLLREAEYHGDIERLGKALRSRLTREGIKALRAELHR
jgi:hypothetical protein